MVSFSLFLDAFPTRSKMPFTYVVNVYSAMSLSKGHLCIIENYFSYFSTTKYVAYTEKNCFKNVLVEKTINEKCVWLCRHGRWAAF